MSSPNTISYTVDSNPAVVFQYPTLTVTDIPVMAGRGDFTAYTKKIYTIRAIVLIASGNLDETIYYLQQVLGTPGGALTISYDGWGSGTQLDIDPTLDIRGGPKPTRVEITKIYGGNALMVHWEIVHETYPTPSGYQGIEGAWVDMVYTVSTQLDQNFYAIRTIAGMLHLNRQYTLNASVSADSFRNTLANYFQIPPASKGYWQRIRQDFVANEDDTILNFVFVDKQNYAWLPAFVNSGDVDITTSSFRDNEHGVMGTLGLTGYFEGVEYAPRAIIHSAVMSVVNLFTSAVLFRIQEETKKNDEQQFWVEGKNYTFIHRWGSNRVDFDLNWEVHGQFTEQLMPNIEYTTGVVLDWLAYATRELATMPANAGPYGTSQTAGGSGVDQISAPLILDFQAKMEKSRTFSFWNVTREGKRFTPSGGGDTTARMHSTASRNNISFHQKFDYKIDQGLKSFPVVALSGSAYYNDVVQQVSTPQIFLTVTGETERADTPPIIPPPPYPLVDTTYTGGVAIDTDDPKALLISMDAQPSAPTGSGRFKITWRYVLKLINVEVPSNVETGLGLRLPWTPNYSKGWLDDGSRVWGDWATR